MEQKNKEILEILGYILLGLLLGAGIGIWHVLDKFQCFPRV
jgi:hypothetical protein